MWITIITWVLSILLGFFITIWVTDFLAWLLDIERKRFFRMVMIVSLVGWLFMTFVGVLLMFSWGAVVPWGTVMNAIGGAIMFGIIWGAFSHWLRKLFMKFSPSRYV